MALNSKQLILDKDKLIESIWQYRWWILQNTHAILITVLHKKQYKKPTGQHKQVAPAELRKVRKKGLSEWFELNRGYKGIFKWYIQDFDRFIDQSNPDFFHLHFSNQSELKDYETLTNMRYEQLIGLSFGLLTYLSRNQPLSPKQSTTLQVAEAVSQFQYELTKDLTDYSYRRLKTRLESKHLGYEIFKTIYCGREEEYIKSLASEVFLKALRSKTEEIEQYWYAEHSKFKEPGDRYKTAEVEAEYFWSNSLSEALCKKFRSKYIQRLELDTSNISVNIG